ncbi:glutathione S-transferase [Litoreibacter janthinus]|uniref:Glutathione S-transferase n=1 Tax=Litoreibacter janthinus TaxID=670154 RepID=A0A1I6GG05_9RHOB|nr:glutathione S-transferase [Litoreibacter janthinus]SFR41109.1 glutathione S-transferase [Litoreibacter janthinus]
MTYDLLIGDRSYSSWSLRGWLLFAKFGLDVTVHDTRFYIPQFQEDLKPFAPARTVPVMRLPEGAIVMDSLAMAETLAERHPEKGYWPADTSARALARGMVAEMHSGYGALRSACPMNLRQSFVDFPVSDEVAADVARIDMLWAAARDLATEGPWLFGAYSIADAFFAPVAARMAGYGLPVSEASKPYIVATISDPTFLDWRRRGLQDAPQSTYDLPYAAGKWPGPD